VNACRAHPKVAVLTGPAAGPAELGAALAGYDRTLVVAELLGAAGERITTCTPAEAAAGVWRDPNVALVLGPGALDPGASPAPPGWRAPREATPPGWALAEAAFEHRSGMITKAEVRAFALARLGPRTGDLVWDVGAGSGAVAVECARFGAAVVAVERDPEAAALVSRNAGRFGVEVRVVIGTAPEVLAGLPDPDLVFVGGGGRGAVAACARRAPRVLVAALATLDRVPEVQAELRQAGYAVDGTVIQASRLARLGEGSRLAATNPVFLLWGERP
jgi:precorrin-6Y C5,15-methyltransferase (decarboxylating)